MSDEYEEDEFEYAVKSLDEYRVLVLRMESLDDLAERIADRWSKQGTTITRFGVDSVYYTYSDGCHCHPEEYSGEFPAALLFDPEWEAVVKAKHDKIEQEKAEMVRAELQRREEKRLRDELSAYERLKKKFEGSTESGVASE